MGEAPRKRRPKCVWVSRDDSGRPSCEHGPAVWNGQHWLCAHNLKLRRKTQDKAKAAAIQSAYSKSEKGRAAAKKYRLSVKGKEAAARDNSSESAHRRKWWYDLTRIR